jgi:hypothetical protein
MYRIGSNCPAVSLSTAWSWPAGPHHTMSLSLGKTQDPPSTALHRPVQPYRVSVALRVGSHHRCTTRHIFSVSILSLKTYISRLVAQVRSGRATLPDNSLHVLQHDDSSTSPLHVHAGRSSINIRWLRYNSLSRSQILSDHQQMHGSYAPRDTPDPSMCSINLHNCCTSHATMSPIQQTHPPSTCTLNALPCRTPRCPLQGHRPVQRIH